MADRMGLLLVVEGLSDFKNATITVQKLNDGVAESMQDVEKASGGAKKGTASLTKSFIKGSLAARAITKGLNMVTGMAKKLIVGSTMLAARVDVLGTVLQTVGGNAGYSQVQLAAFEKAVKANGITTQATRQSLIQMAQAEIDLSNAVDLSRVAQDAAVIAGIDSSQAFQRMIVAIQRGSPLMLRTMGINVNFQQSYEAMAKSLDKNTKQLTASEKVQARVNTVMQAGSQIAGSYAGAMEQAGKQMTSLPRYLEEIQLALGEAFQPAFTTMIFALKERLGELLEYLQDPATKKALDDFAVALDKFLKLLIKVADQAATDTPKIVEFFRKVAVGIADITQETSVAEETVANFWTSLKQFATWWWAMLAAQVEGLKQLIVVGAEIVDAFTPVAAGFKLLKGEMDLAEYIEAGIAGFADVGEAAEGFGDKVTDAFDEAFVAAGQFLGVIEEIPSGAGRMPEALEALAAAASGATEAVEELGEATLEMSEDMLKAAEALVELRLRLQRDYADRLIKLERETIKREIQLAREREAIARRTAAAISDAYEDAEEARREAAEDSTEEIAGFERDAAEERANLDRGYAQTRLDIERDTRRKLEQIQRDFEMSVKDAARTRDAFALVSAQRRAARERENALRGRKEQLTDARTEYERQRADMQRSLTRQRADLQRSLSERQQDIEEQLRERLLAIEENLVQEGVERDRQRAREREDEALQAAWEEEDRQRRLARQLEDMERQYGVLLNVTAEGLLEQVEEWADAYGPEGAASKTITDFAKLVEEQLDNAREAVEAFIESWLEAIEVTGRAPLTPLPTSPEYTLRSPKLGLQIGLENLQRYLKTKPLSIMPGGAMPATKSSSTFSRTENIQKTEATHNVNMNAPSNLDIIVQRQMIGVVRQVLAE